MNDLLVWGDRGPEPSERAQTNPANANKKESLAQCGRRVLLTADPLCKADITHQGWMDFHTGGRSEIGNASAPDVPARPLRPPLVPPKLIPSLKQSTLPLNVYTLHNLAHVELNAIDLAWDTVVRFSTLKLPEQFYLDFARVADDESRHLRWCLQRLKELGYEYGCMPAHNLLWEGCQASAGDITSRLAIVPLSQEARGLDAGERLAERLVGWGDNRSAAIVAKIAEEEKAHVAVGVFWFRQLCDGAGLDPKLAFPLTVKSLCPDLLKGPFHHRAREEVGLARSWYDSSCWCPEVETAINAEDGQRVQALKELGARISSMLELELLSSSFNTN